MNGTDELDALRFEDPAGTLGIIHQETYDRSLRKVGMIGVGEAEDLSLTAVWQPEERELASSCSSGRPRASR
jgi:hypothetical protein